MINSKEKDALNLIIKLLENFDPYYPEEPTFYTCFFCGARKPGTFQAENHKWNCFYSNAKKLINESLDNKAIHRTKTVGDFK